MTKEEGASHPDSSPEAVAAMVDPVPASIPIAHRLFDGEDAECELEEKLEDAGVHHARLGWDDYDNSLEIHGMLAADRLSEAAQRIVYEAGFSKVCCNHDDKWETHYNFDRREVFRPVEGWRVSYPHRRGEEGGKILVEKTVPTWPAQWFETGYVLIQPAQGIEAGTAETRSGSVPLDESPVPQGCARGDKL